MALPTHPPAPAASLRLAPPRPYGPAAVITRRAAERLREGHLWVYRSDVTELVPAIENESPAPGSLLTVLDTRAIPLGTALYSSSSEITLRLVSSEPALTRETYLQQLRQRLANALALRRQLAPDAFPTPGTIPETNALRLVFSEADNLPGIVIDRYANLIILQLLTQGTAQPDTRAAIVETLIAELSQNEPNLTIIERPDPKIRDLEQLPSSPADPLHAPADPALSTILTLNGLRFHFDATTGQKTGAFLDQRLNYAAAARHATGDALDICTYHGGFALHLARTAHTVTGVDASRAALRVADSNLDLNPTLPASVSWIEADAFELLREFEATHRLYDTIILDPPAFAKSRRAIEGALRGYKELNLRALKLLRPGGTLITCSCSHHVSLPDFTGILQAAAIDARRRVQLLETRGAAPDHPAILTLPETSYLKCLILRAE